MSSSSSEEEDFQGLGDMFTEPPRPPSPEPTMSTYTRERSDSDTTEWTRIDIRLVGSHPLWGHHLWNASLAFASYLDDHPDLYRDLCVLELGAGGALPGIVSVKNGARRVVLTDYPDAALIDNICYNVIQNVPELEQKRVSTQGYIWGRSVDPLLKPLPTSDTSDDRGFDLIIMSDLIFNHSQHDAMLTTCENALAKSRPACALVFFTHHRPHLADRDMGFFTKARERGWVCEEILNRKYPPMFPEDPGEEEIRATVHGWRLARASQESRGIC